MAYGQFKWHTPYLTAFFSRDVYPVAPFRRHGRHQDEQRCDTRGCTPLAFRELWALLICPPLFSVSPLTPTFQSILTLQWTTMALSVSRAAFSAPKLRAQQSLRNDYNHVARTV